jgi:hypothetical protein
VHSIKTVDELKAMHGQAIPEYIKGMMLLRGGLASRMSPADRSLAGPLPVDPGDSTGVFILVGKKP